jgi:hypothetical protein
MSTDNTYFSASIRVVKSLIEINFMFDTVEVVREKVILAPDKEAVKTKMYEEYPQFFQNGKVYEKETKDTAQFFYVVIKKLSNWEASQIEAGTWTCDHCGEVHPNKYESRIRYTTKPPFVGLLFCDNGNCLDEYKKEYYKDFEMPDDENFVKSDSLNYIYKCTEKSTGKCYIGKTRNAPFFRWWNHLTHSSSPFGLYFRTTKLSDWTFEVLEELPSNMSDSDVFKIESDYIIKFDCISNGFNSLISNKKPKQVNQISAFDPDEIQN